MFPRTPTQKVTSFMLLVLFAVVVVLLSYTIKELKLEAKE